MRASAIHKNKRLTNSSSDIQIEVGCRYDIYSYICYTIYVTIFGVKHRSNEIEPTKKQQCADANQEPVPPHSVASWRCAKRVLVAQKKSLHSDHVRLAPKRWPDDDYFDVSPEEEARYTQKYVHIYCILFDFLFLYA